MIVYDRCSRCAGARWCRPRSCLVCTQDRPPSLSWKLRAKRTRKAPRAGQASSWGERSWRVDRGPWTVDRGPWSLATWQERWMSLIIDVTDLSSDRFFPPTFLLAVTTHQTHPFSLGNQPRWSISICGFLAAWPKKKGKGSRSKKESFDHSRPIPSFLHSSCLFSPPPPRTARFSSTTTSPETKPPQSLSY